MLKLMGNPAIAVAGKLKADGLNTIHQVSLCFHPLGTPGFGFVVESAPWKVHKPTPPLDTVEEVFPPRDDFPFVPEWLMLFCNPFFRNSFSRVSLPTRRSSFSTLSFNAASSVGSLLNLPRLYCLFQW
jgi:hypothetical protein